MKSEAVLCCKGRMTTPSGYVLIRRPAVREDDGEGNARYRCCSLPSIILFECDSQNVERIRGFSDNKGPYCNAAVLILRQHVDGNEQDLIVVNHHWGCVVAVNPRQNGIVQEIAQAERKQKRFSE